MTEATVKGCAGVEQPSWVAQEMASMNLGDQRSNRRAARLREMPSQGVEAIEWLLLTACAVQTFDQAGEIMSWYPARWSIERLSIKSSIFAESPRAMRNSKPTFLRLSSSLLSSSCCAKLFVNTA